MTFDEVVQGRRSIRGYKPEPAPRALIRTIIERAMRAPSSLNTQPWNFYVIAGGPGTCRHPRLSGHHVLRCAGWPDDSLPADAVVSNRKSVDDAVVFVGFEG